MPDLRDELASVVERLASRVQELERRVASLERQRQAGVEVRPQAAPSPVVSHPLQDLSLARSGGVMPVIGLVFLGLAGGYLLRAVAEFSAFPRLAIVPVALAYAGMWLVWAARTSGDVRFAASAYGITSALVLTPMLWELTLRFKALPAAATASVLVAFVAAASALAWKRSLTPVVWVATLAAAGEALALMPRTLDLVPFTLALLAIALMTEAAACLDRWRSLRPVAALSADLAVLALVLVFARKDSLPPGYKPVAAGVLLALPVLLFAIYGASVAFRTVVRRKQITVFEIGQTVAALVLASAGVLMLTDGAAAPALGICFLMMAAASYYAALGRFERPLQPRNYHVCASWAAAFFLAGSFFLRLPPAALALCLGVAALAAIFIGVRSGRLTLGFHGVLFLAASAWGAGLAGFVFDAMSGTVGAPSLMVWIAAILTASVMAVAWRSVGDQAGSRVLRLLCSFFALCAVSALVVSGMAWIASGGAGVATVSPPRLAVIRTLVVCLAALALALGGSRLRRAELVWLAYTSIAFCTLKLLYEDLRNGTAGSLAVSLFLYGMVWVLVPRLGKAKEPVHE